MPTEEEALKLYRSAVDCADSGQIDEPWEFQRSFGKGSFELLSKYLRKKALI